MMRLVDCTISMCAYGGGLVVVGLQVGQDFLRGVFVVQCIAESECQ